MVEFNIINTIHIYIYHVVLFNHIFLARLFSITSNTCLIRRPLGPPKSFRIAKPSDNSFSNNHWTKNLLNKFFIEVFRSFCFLNEYYFSLLSLQSLRSHNLQI